MTTLSSLVAISVEERPFIDFESSLRNDQVVAGYIPVKSTLDVLAFLKHATAPQSPQGRAVICHGSYGSGKSRLCTVLARLFSDGFDCPALVPVWRRLEARGEASTLEDLKKGLMPGGRAWHPWLVVPVYAQGGGGTLSASLIRGLVKATRQLGLGEEALGNTIYHAAAARLMEMTRSGATYTPAAGSRYATVQQLERALTGDLDETALTEFRDFHRLATHGVEFQDYVQASGGTAMEAHDVYNAVVERLQPHGYDGIIVIWDEFGFAVEELLRDAQRGTRSLAQETMKLQEFLERACGNRDFGKRIILLGFTHVSLPEYGTRERLNETDQNRLDTVSGRFRDPPIPIRLSVTEREGYHLIAGMLQRTAEGCAVLANPMPKLQRLADRMPKHLPWQRYGPSLCYDEIAAACYPLHPATATSLLLLSDQIAQINRTTFYYLQNRDQGGLAQILGERERPALAEIGGSELARVHDMFVFFEEAIKTHKRHLYDQYEESLARFPDASELDRAILQTVLILSVIASGDMAPTTGFLSFCHCDALRDEAAAQPLQSALDRLSAAGSLWKNEATDVWSFVGGKGLASDIDREVDEERALVPDYEAARLLRHFPQIQAEIAERIGDFDLDPAESGIVRRIGIRILDLAKGDRAVEQVNPARDGAEEAWRSALVYLVAADTPVQLDFWRRQAAATTAPNVYFVFPRQEVRLDRERIRDLIAVTAVLNNTSPESHAYEVLDGRFTRLRLELRQQFEQAFGNAGLRSGTEVVPAGQPDKGLPVDSWNQLLPAVAVDLDRQFPHQLRVRCGTFNEWKTGSIAAPLGNIVRHILQFDEGLEYQAEFLGFKETSQEAAIVDGVLVENRFLKKNDLHGKWELLKVDKDCPFEALREILRHFETSGDRDFSKLFAKLVDPPYGVPNGILPLLVAMVFRTEGPRIAVYTGSQNQRVSDARVPDAIVDMARHPGRYITRFTKLTGKQRTVFRALGPLIGVSFHDRLSSGEAFYGYCEQVRSRLRVWTDSLPEGVLKLSELTESQRKLLRLLRAPIPPQLPILADGLVEVVQEDTTTHEELLGGSSLTAFPAIERTWRDLRSKVDRYVEGVRAPLRTAVRELVTASGPVVAGNEPEALGTSAKVVAALQEAGKVCCGDDNPFQRIAERVAATNPADPIEAVAAAVSGKPPAALTDEDFGKASGILEAAAAVRKQEAQHRASGQYMVVLPSGERRSLKSALQQDVEGQVTAAVSCWRTELSLPAEQIAFSVLRALFVDPPLRAAADVVEERPVPAPPDAPQAADSVGMTD